LIAALIIIGLILYFAIRSQKSLGKAGETSQEQPLIIAKRRYALGQITKEEYETIKRDIK
jgi:putative membrane protein